MYFSYARSINVNLLSDHKTAKQDNTMFERKKHKRLVERQSVRGSFVSHSSFFMSAVMNRTQEQLAIVDRSYLQLFYHNMPNISVWV